jgi:hypothetical protein
LDARDEELLLDSEKCGHKPVGFRVIEQAMRCEVKD